MTITEHKIHDSLPSGFVYADTLQVAQFYTTGFVHGASKVCLVRTKGDPYSDELAVRLRPPRTLNDIRSPLGRRAAAAQSTLNLTEVADWYIAQYNLGWQASTRVGRTGQSSEAWESGFTNNAWDDGYLDQAAGRPKWHLTYCADHDECGEG